MDPTDIETAAEALRRREGIGANRANQIGRWTAGGNSPDTIMNLPEWAASHSVEAVIWTALPPKFANNDGQVPTANDVIAHLDALTGAARDTAERYVRFAPRQIDTRVRRRIEAALHWTWQLPASQ